MKYKLPVITLDMIDSWEPCDPVESFTFVPPDWSGTVFDILDCEQLSVDNRIWLVLREEVMELRDIRLFALRCAKRVEHLDETGIAKRCNDVTEQYLRGEATEAEVVAARKTAWVAASSAAADRAAARAAVEAADTALTKYATVVTAKYAAIYAAAAGAAVMNAASAAARGAARATECAAQIQILKDILTS